LSFTLKCPRKTQGAWRRFTKRPSAGRRRCSARTWATTYSSLRPSRMLLALAVSSPKRAALLPDAPSVVELPQFRLRVLDRRFQPVKTPRDIVDQFHREAIKTMQLRKVKEGLEMGGMDRMALTPAEFDARVRAEIASTGLLAKAAGLSSNQ